MGLFENIGLGFQALGDMVNPFNWQSHSSGLGSSLQELSGNVANSVYADSQALWDREDSAYQRMVADMKKAGLNPWTGIESGGLSAGSNVPALDSLNGLLNTLTTSLDAQKTTNDTFKTYSDFGYKIGNLANKVVGTIGSLVGQLS